jgi:hypothetical protein
MYQDCSVAYHTLAHFPLINIKPFSIARQGMPVCGWRRPAEEAKYVEEPGREPVDGLARSALSRMRLV